MTPILGAVIGLAVLIYLIFIEPKIGTEEYALDKQARELQTKIEDKLIKKWGRYIYDVQEGNKTAFKLRPQSFEAVLAYIQDFRELKGTMTTEMYDRIRSSIFMSPILDTINGLPLNQDRAFFGTIEMFTSTNNIPLNKIKKIHICEHGSIIDIVPGKRDHWLMRACINCKSKYAFNITGKYLDKDSK